MERPYADVLNGDSSSYAEFANRYGSSMASSSTTSSPPTITVDGDGDSATGAGRNGGVKYCGVCGDIAKSYHFGGLSCDSCKAFFRRSVQNDNYLHFQCCHRGQCTISLSNRKSCQYCRMKRCFSIGMEKSWVMTEEERKALMKARAEKKQHKQTGSGGGSTSGGDESQAAHSSNYEPQIDRMGDFMTPLEIKELESIVTKYMHAYQHVPYRRELREFDNRRPGVQVMEMFGTLIRRFAFYARLMPDFGGLPFHDQSILLKGGVLEMCLLRGALVFDPVNNRWPNVNMSLYKDSPVLRLDDIGHLTSTRLFQMHLDFIACIQSMGVDEPTIMLLILVVLYTPERAGLVHANWIEKYQSYYTGLLEHYMNWRYGLVKAKFMFGKLLTRLSDLRELSDTHNHHNLRLDNEEITSIQSQLNSLKLNPYPEMKVVPDGNDSAPVITGWPSRGDSTVPAPNNENPAIIAKDISSCLSEAELKSPSPVTYGQQQPDASSAYGARPAPAGQSVINGTAHHGQQQQQPNGMSMQHLHMLQQQGQMNGMVQQQQQQHQQHQQHQFQAHQQMSQEQMNMMAMQFMHAMQRSVSQVANQPHFGFEWVKPDYQFDPEATFGNMDADPGVSSDSASSSDGSLPPTTPHFTQTNSHHQPNGAGNGVIHHSARDPMKFAQHDQAACPNSAAQTLGEFSEVVKEYGSSRMNGLPANNGHIFGH